jgi:hypothetical protein
MSPQSGCETRLMDNRDIIVIGGSSGATTPLEGF